MAAGPPPGPAAVATPPGMGRQIDIEPASIAAVKRTDKGKLVAIDDDVVGVARDLKAIDAALKLSYDPDQDYYVVYEVRVLGDGSVEEHLVTTARECDQRIVWRVKEISRPGYDYAAELEKVEAAAKKARDDTFREELAPRAERLRHALRKDLGLDHDRIFVGRDVIRGQG